MGTPGCDLVCCVSPAFAEYISDDLLRGKKGLP